jgi:predicted DNA-binding transcriptional regulator AlpA
MKLENSPRYVKECEVSCITGLALQTLRNYRSKGIGPVYCKIGRSVRYPLADLVSWIEGFRVHQQDQSKPSK